jgi:uncharacterized membrane protein
VGLSMVLSCVLVGTWCLLLSLSPLTRKLLVQIINVSRVVIVAYGILMGVFSIVLFEIGLSLGWVYLFMGIVIGSAVFPVYACLTWKKTSAIAAIAGTPHLLLEYSHPCLFACGPSALFLVIF